MSERRRVRDAALVGLAAEIALRRSELAVLERAYDTIERGDVQCDVADGRRCSALVHTGICRVCSFAVRRCKAHGGQHSATAALRQHERSHGVGWPDSAATDDAGGVLSGGASVSLGSVQAPPASDRERDELASQPSQRSEAPESRRAGNGA